MPGHPAQPWSACFKKQGHGFSLRAGIHLGKGQRAACESLMK